MLQYLLAVSFRACVAGSYLPIAMIAEVWFGMLGKLRAYRALDPGWVSHWMNQPGVMMVVGPGASGTLSVAKTVDCSLGPRGLRWGSSRTLTGLKTRKIFTKTWRRCEERDDIAKA